MVYFHITMRAGFRIDGIDRGLGNPSWNRSFQLSKSIEIIIERNRSDDSLLFLSPEEMLSHSKEYAW